MTFSGVGWGPKGRTLSRSPQDWGGRSSSDSTVLESGGAPCSARGG